MKWVASALVVGAVSGLVSQMIFADAPLIWIPMSLIGIFAVAYTWLVLRMRRNQRNGSLR